MCTTDLVNTTCSQVLPLMLLPIAAELPDLSRPTQAHPLPSTENEVPSLLTRASSQRALWLSNHSGNNVPSTIDQMHLASEGRSWQNARRGTASAESSTSHEGWLAGLPVVSFMASRLSPPAAVMNDTNWPPSLASPPAPSEVRLPATKPFMLSLIPRLHTLPRARVHNPLDSSDSRVNRLVENL